MGFTAQIKMNYLKLNKKYTWKKSVNRPKMAHIGTVNKNPDK